MKSYETFLNNTCIVICDPLSENQPRLYLVGVFRKIPFCSKIWPQLCIVPVCWVAKYLVSYILVFIKPCVCGLRPNTWFLEIALARASVCLRVCVCLSVCPPPRALITSGVIWCNIDCVRLVKQVLLLLITSYSTLLLIKWMGVNILTQYIMNICQRKLRWHGTY